MCLFARETAGAASTRHSLRPVLFGRNDLQSPGETRRGNAKVCLSAVIANLRRRRRCKVGDKVQFEAENAGGAYTVTKMQKSK
jgi:hypothetical protein